MLQDIRTFLKKGRLRNVEQTLRFYISVSDAIVAIGLFSVIFTYKLQLLNYFSSTDPIDILPQTMKYDFWLRLHAFMEQKGKEALLALFTFIWYFTYKSAVRKEMDIVVQLYSRFNPPHNWENVVGRHWIPLLSIGLTAAYLALAWFIDDIKIYCIILLLLNVLDIRGNSIIRLNLSEYFLDKNYIPVDSDLHKRFIMRRREIAEQYCIRKPQLERIGLMMAANMFAFVLASSDTFAGVRIWEEIPYIVVIAIIVANEITMFGWRRQRNRAIESVEREQEIADRDRSHEPDLNA